MRKDSTRFWASGVVRAVRDEEGNLRGFAKVARDVTDRKKAEDTLSLLAEAGAELSSSLDYRATLSRVARLAVPALSDWCAVDILDEAGSVERLAVAHQDPQKVELAHVLQERYPPDPGRSLRRAPGAENRRAADHVGGRPGTGRESGPRRGAP